MRNTLDIGMFDSFQQTPNKNEDIEDAEKILDDPEVELSDAKKYDFSSKIAELKAVIDPDNKQFDSMGSSQLASP